MDPTRTAASPGRCTRPWVSAHLEATVPLGRSEVPLTAQTRHPRHDQPGAGSTALVSAELPDDQSSSSTTRSAPLRAVMPPRARSCRVPVVGAGSSLGVLIARTCSDVAWSDHATYWWCRAEDGPLVNASPAHRFVYVEVGGGTRHALGHRGGVQFPSHSASPTRRDVTSWSTNSRKRSHAAGAVTPDRALSGEPRSPEASADTSVRGSGRSGWRDCG